MKPSSVLSTPHRGILVSAIAALAAVAPSLRAANTWDGGGVDGNWSTVLNWDDDQLPAFAAGVTFAGLANLVTNNDLAGVALGGIAFDASADSFTLGGNAVTLSGSITNNSAVPQTIHLPITLAAATTVEVGIGGATTIGPGLSGSGVISGNFGITKTGFGSLTLGAANTYTGTTTLEGGTVTYGATNTVGALHFGTAPTAATASANTSTLDLTNASLSASSLAAQTNSGVPNFITIGAGQALAVNGAATVSVPTVYTENFGGVTTNLTVSGAGTLAVNSGTGHFTVSLPRSNAAGGGDPNATADLSGLSHFIYTATTGELRVGAGNAPGTMRLANTSNTITAAQIRIADTSLGVGDNGAASSMFLGAGTNELRTNNLIIGFRKGTGNLAFQNATGSVTISGQAGGASVANITVGDASSGTGGGTSQLQLAGHMATVQAGIVRVGQLNNSSGGTPAGRITFDTGTFTANSLRLANHSAGTAANGVSGTFELGGFFPDPAVTGVLNVNGEFLIANRTVTANARPVTGTFTINGGTANINADILIVDNSPGAAARTTTLTLAGGTLNMMGHSIATAALPIDFVNLPSFGQTATLANLGGAGINGAGLSFTSGGTLTLEGSNTYTGPTVISAGTLQVGTGGNSGTLGTGAITNDGTLIIDRSGSLTIAGAISGTGSLQKDGTAAVVIEGAANYTGATTINGGTLALTGTVGAVTVSPGTRLRTGFGSPAGTLSAAALTVTGGDLAFDFDAAGALLSVTGTASFSGASTITANPLAPAGMHTLVAAGVLDLAASPSLVAPTDTRKTFALDFATANTIKLVVTGASKSLAWTGGVNGAWDAGVAGTANWSDGLMAETFFNADAVTFGDGPANRAVTITGITVQPASVVVNSSAGNDYTIGGSGGIGGSASLTKDGTGAIALASANSYSGGTTLLGGVLAVNHPAALGAGELTIAGGSLDNTTGAAVVVSTSNAQTWSGDFGFAGTNPLHLGTGAVTLSAPVAVSVNASALTVGGAIQGAFPLTKAGPGTLVLAGTSAPTSVTITAGTLQIGDGGATGSLGAAPISNNGTLAFNRSDDLTLAALIDGAGEVVNAGAGILTLAAANTYLGPTLIEAGKVRVTNAAGGLSSLGALPGGNVTVVSGGALDLSGNPTAQALNFGAKLFRIEGTGPDGAGAIVNFGVSQFNALQQVELTGDATVGGSQRFDIRSVPTSALNARLDLAGFTLTKEGGNQFSLVGVDVTDGDIIVNQGIFAIETVTNIPDFGTGRKITLNAGTTLQFFNATAPISAVARPMVFNGAGIQVGAANNVNSYVGSAMTLNGDITVTALNNTTAASTLTLTGNIGETGVHSITKTGPSVLALSGNNSFTGGVVINGGTVQMLSATALGAAGSPLTVNTGGTLDVAGQSPSIGALSGTGGVITNTFGGDVTLLTTTSGDTTFAGSIDNGFGTVNLHKRGPGSLALTGANTYTGNTIVEQGELTVNGSIAGSAIVDGGVLSGNGRVGITSLLDGLISPGDVIGALKTANLSVEGGELLFEIDGAMAGAGAGFHDQVQVFGTVSILAPVELSLNFAGYDPVDFVDSFVLVNNDGADGVSLFGMDARFTYGGLALEEGAQFSAISGANSQEFTITYAGGDSGNDIVLHAIPEPGASLVLLAGLGVVAARRTRFSRHAR